MHFAHSKYFLLFLLAPLLFFLLFYWGRKYRRAMIAFCDEKFIPKLMPYFSRSRKRLRVLFLLAALTLTVLALAEPQWGYHYEEVLRKGVDIFLIVDVSNSMLAEDLKPSRLERARRKIYDFLRIAQGDRLGMIAFAGKSVLLCPLTLDYEAIHQFLEDLSPDLIPIQGTDLSGALKLAVKDFKDPNSSKAVLVFTDGEDNSSDLQSATKLLADQKIPLFILGFGTPEGAPIPLPQGEGGFKRDRAGNVVISKLDESLLSQLTSSTKGAYARAVTGDEDLNELYIKGLKKALSESEVKGGKKKVYDSRYQWPLGMALLFLLAEMGLGETKKGRGNSSS